VNAFGQVGVDVSFLNLDGNGSYVFTPALHWRSASGGNWDTNTNWTVGLAPAFVHDVSIDPSTALTVTGPATSRVVNSLQVGSGGAPATLQLTDGTTLRTLDTISVDAGGGSRVDLRDGTLITRSPVGSWTGSTYSGVSGLVRSGFNLGGTLWAGPGITTSLGGNGSSNFHALGVIVNDLASVGQPSGPIYTSFGGQDVGVNDVLVKYTYFGDADLDGAVTTNDYFQIDNGFLGSKTGWINGDFDYDGAVTTNDYFLIDNAFLGQGAALAALGSAEPLSGVTAVPEPASLGGLAFAGGYLLARRSRRARDL
jgi:hypothetical protein